MVAELQNKNSHWYMFFENVKKNNEKVVLLTTGWRSAPSTANILFEIFQNKRRLFQFYMQGQKEIALTQCCLFFGGLVLKMGISVFHLFLEYSDDDKYTPTC